MGEEPQPLSAAPGPAPLPAATSLYPPERLALARRRWPERASPAARSRRLTWFRPRSHAALSPRAPRPPAAGLFWVLGGYFPSGLTSLPVKESEVGAGPPLHPPPPASSCHLGEHTRPPRAPSPLPPHLASGPLGTLAKAPLASFGPSLSPLPFPRRRKTVGRCFRLETEGWHLQTAQGSMHCKVWFDVSCQISSPKAIF